MRLLSLLVVLSYLLCSGGCDSMTARVARVVRVSVSDDEGRPLAGIPVEIDGIATTKTGRDGAASISLARSGPARARIAVTCAAGQRELSPRHVARESEGGTAKLELSFRCRPHQRKLVIVVRAPGGEGLLVRADGHPLGHIEADGTLHASLSRAPDSELRLMIDTADLPLTPRNPVRAVRVLDRDELVVFDQSITPSRAGTKPRPALFARREAPSSDP